MIYKQIKLSNGMTTTVDAENYNWLNQWKWHCSHKGYAVRNLLSNGCKAAYLHRLVMDAPKEKQVDHINQDKLDNRKVNLRLCTNSQNQQNTVPRTGGASKYKGVRWNCRQKRWIARVTVHGKRSHLGCFTDEIEAAKAYDTRAIELYGEFACINFPGVSDETC